MSKNETTSALAHRRKKYSRYHYVKDIIRTTQSNKNFLRNITKGDEMLCLKYAKVTCENHQTKNVSSKIICQDLCRLFVQLQR